jgi:kumamolisin
MMINLRSIYLFIVIVFIITWTYAQTDESAEIVDTAGTARSFAKYYRKLENNETFTPNNDENIYTVSEVSKIYGLKSRNDKDKRVSIAIIELGGGYYKSDLDAYWKHIGLKTKPNIYDKLVDGAYNKPGKNKGYDIEVALDIQIVGGIVPNSDIYVYFAPNTFSSFINALNRSIRHEPKMTTISISWGLEEFDSPQIHQFNELLAQAAEQGITVCAASGDNGSNNGKSKPSVIFPSSSPYVLSCGGTNLKSGNKYNSKTKEKAWSGSGGGKSKLFYKPDYQDGIKGDWRMIPDVAGVADPNTGWIIRYDGSYHVIGGTSAVAPMWAGYLAGQRINYFANPILYKNYKKKKIFHDIKSGSNGEYDAEKRYDMVTGLGSPYGEKLSKLLQDVKK